MVPILPVDDPPLDVIVTVAPPLESTFPAASFPVKVRVTALPDKTVEAETAKSEVLELIVPGVTVTVGIEVVTVTPPMVAAIFVALPAKTPVTVAV